MSLDQQSICVSSQQIGKRVVWAICWQLLLDGSSRQEADPSVSQRRWQIETGSHIWPRRVVLYMVSLKGQESKRWALGKGGIEGLGSGLTGPRGGQDLLWQTRKAITQNGVSTMQRMGAGGCLLARLLHVSMPNAGGALLWPEETADVDVRVVAHREWAARRREAVNGYCQQL